MNPYISALYEIVTKGRNTNSYKFALWRALASLAPDTDEQNPKITKLDLAPVFLKYFWPLEIKYHLRQGIDPNKDPVVMKLIRQRVAAGTIKEGEPLKDFQKRMPDDCKQLVTIIAHGAFDDVIPRFHTVHGSAIKPSIFTFSTNTGRSGEAIELTKGGREFLIDHRKLIDYVAVSGWVRFTEQFTSAPRLHDKIDGANVVRGAVSRWRDVLMAIQNGKCFYGDDHDMDHPEVDHVLPWSFVLEDKTWNLVAACRKCNNGKRDRLTTTDAMERLCARNGKIASGETGAAPPFQRDFAEWHSRDLSSHIKGLYDQALADSFPVWA